jgi:hypothetical protein
MFPKKNAPNDGLKNREITRKALKSLELEGMQPSKEMLHDLELLNTGIITREEFLARGLNRAKEINHEQRSLRLS